MSTPTRTWAPGRPIIRAASRAASLHNNVGWSYFETAGIALARGDKVRAAAWAGKAHALLEDDGYLNANEPARPARLSNLAQGNAP
jgi:nitroreductase